MILLLIFMTRFLAYGFYLYMTLVHGSRKSVISQFLVDVQETELAVNLGTAKGQLVTCELDTLHLSGRAT
ncbi:unknown [Parabacteroides merdae CAG:48]|nr:unknown [Parabacteroides merdae CAG:48]